MQVGATLADAITSSNSVVTLQLLIPVLPGVLWEHRRQFPGVSSRWLGEGEAVSVSEERKGPSSDSTLLVFKYRVFSTSYLAISTPWTQPGFCSKMEAARSCEDGNFTGVLDFFSPLKTRYRVLYNGTDHSQTFLLVLTVRKENILDNC